ncbi:MAG TPA: hypothetical protein VF665_18110, partial [Longimicrobium sp.]|uniref:hypothetical protein n=1 Tax=Longimicrobium sp. TaxID=2029185 RepID=UPI002ED87D6F
MTSFRSRFVAVAALSAAAFLGACSDQSEAPLAAGDVTADRLSAEAPARERMAQLIALSLRDASVRALLLKATHNSPVAEGKLHVTTFLSGEGQPLLRAMSRASGLSLDEVSALAKAAGSMEIYLPVPAHRAAWTGGSDLQVAVQERDRVGLKGFDLNGNAVQLSSDVTPTTPTVVITHAEGFDAQGKAHGIIRANFSRAATGAPSYNHDPYAAQFTGLWANEVHTSSDFESWASGSPEFEFWVVEAETRNPLTCVGESSVEPNRFNMDGTNYYTTFLIAADNELPQGVNRAVAMYEDDDERCVLKTGKDYVKLTVDALTAGNAAHKAIKHKEPGDYGWIVKVWNFALAASRLWGGGDEFVGVS